MNNMEPNMSGQHPSFLRTQIPHRYLTGPILTWQSGYSLALGISNPKGPYSRTFSYTKCPHFFSCDNHWVPDGYNRKKGKKFDARFLHTVKPVALSFTYHSNQMSRWFTSCGLYTHDLCQVSNDSTSHHKLSFSHD